MTSIDQTYLAEPETRVTSESTGGQKGAKLTQLGSLDPASLIELARVSGMGANKYSAYNFMKGTGWSLMYNAMQRHALRYWAGEDNDPESGLHHMAHAAWMALALVGFALRETGDDDRPPSINRSDVGTVETTNAVAAYLTLLPPMAPPCEHPMGQRYYSVAGTYNCGRCFARLDDADAAGLQFVRTDAEGYVAEWSTKWSTTRDD